MDYRALGELIWFALLGLTAFTAVAGLTLRFVLGPFVRELVEAYRERSDRLSAQGEVLHRLERLERHVVEMDGELDEIRQAEEMDRLLEGRSEGAGEG